MPGAGDLTRRLVLEAPASVVDATGGQVIVWTALGEVWAEMRVVSGRERREDPVRLGVTGWRVRLRASAPDSLARPRAGQRFREGPRVFAILSVAEADGGGRWLECRCEEEEVA
jgi:head-tail adaptor